MTEQTTEKNNLIITLTGRAPVQIKKDDWPILAESNDEAYDGQFEFQATRLTHWWLKVRRHADGRAIVYAKYTHETHWRGERSYAIRGGELVTEQDNLPEAIRRVGEWMAAQEHSGDDARRWQALINECIGDLPAEDLA